MKIVLLSIGKPHEFYIKAGIDEFSQRLQKYFPTEWQIIPSPKNAASLPENTLKKEEAKSVLQYIQSDDFVILLDERGKMFSSPELSQLIQRKANDSAKRLIFIIGGAFGVDASLTARASITWSLSKLVFPHMLVRLILTEQLYRACTIMKNEKYHHE